MLVTTLSSSSLELFYINKQTIKTERNVNVIIFLHKDPSWIGIIFEIDKLLSCIIIIDFLSFLWMWEGQMSDGLGKDNVVQAIEISHLLFSSTILSFYQSNKMLMSARDVDLTRELLWNMEWNVQESAWSSRCGKATICFAKNMSVLAEKHLDHMNNVQLKTFKLLNHYQDLSK